jgi:hypothetical protein
MFIYVKNLSLLDVFNKFGSGLKGSLELDKRLWQALLYRVLLALTLNLSKNVYLLGVSLFEHRYQ